MCVCVYMYMYRDLKKNYPVISGKQIKLTRYHEKTKLRYLEIEKIILLSRGKKWKLTCYHRKTEEIKCMNAWPFRASVGL